MWAIQDFKGGKVIGFVFAMATAVASLANPVMAASVNPKLQWIDAEGHVVDVTWKTQTKLVWKKVPPDGDTKHLFLEVTVNIPNQVTIVSVEDKEAKLVKKDKETLLLVHTDKSTFNARLKTKTSTGYDKAGLLISVPTGDSESTSIESAVREQQQEKKER